MDRFGKLENGYFVEYPYIQTDKIIYTNDRYEWLSNGYKILIDSPYPELSGFQFPICVYTEDENYIYLNYEIGGTI